MVKGKCKMGILMPDIASQNRELVRRQARSGRGSRVRPVADIATPALAGGVPHVADDELAAKLPKRRKLSDLDASWHPKVASAIEAAREWQARRNRQGEQGKPQNASLVLIASGIRTEDGFVDPSCTGYGCGKTHIALACMWAESYTDESGTPVAPAGKFFEAARLITNLSPGESPAWEIGAAPIIVIDEVGDEGFIPFVKQDADSQAFERQARYRSVIDYCYRNGVSVVMTSNLTATQLAKHIGGRAWDRLAEMAPLGFIVDMTGVPSWRMKESGR